MPDPNIRTGLVYITIDGQLFESGQGAQLIDAMGIKRKPQIGNAVYGYTEEVVAPTVKAKFSHSSGISLAMLAAIVDATITFSCDSGPVFIIRNAWYQEGMTLTGGEGWVDVTFAGVACIEQGVVPGILNT